MIVTKMLREQMIIKTKSKKFYKSCFKKKISSIDYEYFYDLLPKNAKITEISKFPRKFPCMYVICTLIVTITVNQYERRQN